MDRGKEIVGTREIDRDRCRFRRLIGRRRELGEKVNRIADRGLGHRLLRTARRVADQHRSIDEYYRALSDEIRGRAKSNIHAAFECYRLALTAHFDLEEQVFYPAVHGSDPSQQQLIRQLVATHSRLLTELSHLADSIDSLPTEDLSRRLSAFATILASHESQEEALLTQFVDEAHVRSDATTGPADAAASGAL